MGFFDNFKQETLVDLLKAYDSYIATAADAGLFETGWIPVCVQEFYENEYQSMWTPEKGDASFDYMFDPEDRVNPPHECYDLNGTRIFKEGSELKCRFHDEDHDRYLRNRIQDIRDGDCFIVGSTIHTADGYAHQNIDEPDCPWIVFDVNGDGWFENDVIYAERFLLASAYSKANHDQEGNKIPVNLVDLIRHRDYEGESWSDSFWIDAKIVPTEDLFRTVIQTYLMTDAGREAILETCEDFNWGDAITYLPAEHWKAHGIYPADPLCLPQDMGLAPTSAFSMYSFTVDQDEILIPESYWKEGASKSGPSLDDMIQGVKIPEMSRGSHPQKNMDR